MNSFLTPSPKPSPCLIIVTNLWLPQYMSIISYGSLSLVSRVIQLFEADSRTHSPIHPTKSVHAVASFPFSILPPYDERLNFSFDCYCIGILLFQHILSSRPNDSHSYICLLSIWGKVETNERKELDIIHTHTHSSTSHTLHTKQISYFFISFFHTIAQCGGVGVWCGRSKGLCQSLDPQGARKERKGGMSSGCCPSSSRSIPQSALLMFLLDLSVPLTVSS